MMKKVTKLLLSILMLCSVLPSQFRYSPVQAETAITESVEPNIEPEKSDVSLLSVSVLGNNGIGTRVLKDNNLRSGGRVSLSWATDGWNGDTYSINDGYQTIVVNINMPQTSNTVVVLEIPKYGLEFASVPSADHNPIEEVRKIDDSHYAFRLIDSTSAVTYQFSVTIKQKALTNDKVLEIIDSGYENSRVAVTEYEYSGALQNVLMQGTAVENPDILFEGKPAYDANATITATHTYDYRVPYYSEEGASFTNYVLGYAGIATTPAGTVYNNHYPNNGALRLRLPSLYAETGAAPVEITNIRIYVPTNASKENLFVLQKLGRNINSISGPSTYFSDLGYSDFTQWFDGWSISEKKTDSDGYAYYDITPKTRWTNYNSLGKDEFFGGMALTWQLVNEANSLDQSAEYTSKNTVVTYKLPGTEELTVNFASPKIRTDKGSNTVTITRRYNEDRQWSSGTDLAHEVTKGTVEKNDYFVEVSNYGYSTGSGTNRTHYFPEYEGPVTMVYDFPYEIQPRKITISENKQIVIGNGEQKSKIADIKYVTWSGDEVSIAETNPAAIAEANNLLATGDGYETFLELPLSETPIKKVVVEWTRLVTKLRWQPTDNRNEAAGTYISSGDYAYTARVSFDYYVSTETSTGAPVEDGWVQVKYAETYDGNKPDLVVETKDGKTGTSREGISNENVFWFKIKSQMDPELYGSGTYISNSTNAAYANYRINLLDDGKQDLGRLGFYIGEPHERRDTVISPEIVFGLSMALQPYDTQWTTPSTNNDPFKYNSYLDGITEQQLLAFLSGKFTAAKLLGGWKFVYTTKNNSAVQTYAVPADIADGTEISILDENDYFTSLKLVYEGTLDVTHANNFIADEEDSNNDDIANHRVLFLLNGIELRRLTKNPYTNDPIVVHDDSYMALLTLQASLTYADEQDCTCEGHVHARDKGQPYVTATVHTTNSSYDTVNPLRAWLYSTREAGLFINPKHNTATAVYELRQGEGTASANNGSHTNKHARFTAQVYVRANSPRGNPSGAYSMSFQPAASWRYGAVANRVDAFSPDEANSYFPWGPVGETVYIELTDSEFQPDLHNTTWLGYAADSANIVSEIIEKGGKRFLKLSIAPGVAVKEEVHTTGRTGTTNMISNNGFANELVLHFNTVPGVSLGLHHPVGDVFFDYAGLVDLYNAPEETGYDDNKTRYIMMEAVADTLKLSEHAEDVTDKLYVISGADYTINIGIQLEAGAELTPGKDEIYDFNPRVTEFKPSEENDLNALITIKGPGDPSSDKIYNMAVLVVIPREGLGIKYEKRENGGTVEATSDPSDFSMYLRGEPRVISDSNNHPMYIEVTTEENPSTGSDFRPAAENEDWSKITALAIHVTEVDPEKSINIALDLKADTKSTVNILSAFGGGEFAYSTKAPEPADRGDDDSLVHGYLNLSEWQYGNIELQSGNIFWDIYDENGTRNNNNEQYIKGVEVSLFDAAGTLIDRVTTDTNGKFTLETYKTEAGQYIIITDPSTDEFTAKLTKNSTSLPNTYGYDSDFYRELDGKTNVLVFTSEFDSKGTTNISAGFVKLPNPTSAKDVVVAPGETVNGEVLFREFIEAGTNTDNVLLNGGYKITYTVEDTSIATVANGTLSNPSYRDLKDEPAVTGVAVGETTCTVTLTNCLGDEVTITFNIIVGKFELTAEGYEGIYDAAVHKATLSPTFNGEPVTSGVTYQFSTDGGRTWQSAAVTATYVAQSKTGILVKAVHDKYGETEPVSYDLIIKKRPITLTAGSGEWVYDGEIHYNREVTVTSGSLAGRDELAARASGSVTNVADTAEGNNPVDPRSQIVNRNTDVTNNYDVTLVAGTLTIKPLLITVESASDSFTYDGLTHSNHNYTVSWEDNNGDTQSNTTGKLIGDDKVEVTVSGEITFPSESPAENTVEAKIVLGENGSADNYKLLVIAGELTMTRPTSGNEITIKGATQVWEYDGEEHSNHNVSITSGTLFAGDELIAEATGVVKDFATGVGGNNPVAEDYKIMHTNADGSKTDVTDLYDITVEAGTLGIAPRIIMVRSLTNLAPEGEIFVYNGTAQSFPEYRVYSVHDGYTFDDGKLFSDDTIEVSVTGSITFPRESGSWNTIGSIKVNGVEVTSNGGIVGNYQVRYSQGKLYMVNATGKEITITAASDAWTYDGEAHENTSVTVTEGELFPGDELVAVADGSVTDVADTIEGNNQIVVGYKIMHGEEDVTDNYAITPVNGTLTIKPADVAVTIKGNKATEVYNAKEQIVEGYTVSYSHRLYKQSYIAFSGSAIAKGTDVGVYPMGLAKEQFTNTNGNFNVTFTVEDGSLEITPFFIVIWANNAKRDYNGEPLTQHEWKMPAMGLPEGDTHEFAVEYSEESTITDVGTKDNVIVKVDGVDIPENGEPIVIGNYKVRVDKGKLEVTPAYIVFYAESASKIYDGKPLTCDDWGTATGVTYGHEFVIVMTSDSTITDVGTHTNQIATVDGVEVSQDTRTVIGNFLVTLAAPGQLKVTPREITIAVEDKTVEYNGTEQSGETEYAFTGLVDTHTGTITYTPSKGTLVGTYENGSYADDLLIEDGEGNDVTGNYILKEQTIGKLVITDRSEENKYKVEFTAKSDEVTYDGVEHTVEGFTAELTYTNDLNVVFTIEGITASGNGTNAGEYPVEVSGTPRVLDADGNDVTDQFTFVLNDGTLTIKKLPITLRSSDASKVYDGTPLTNDEVTVIGELPKGVAITFDVTGSQTLPGTSDNTFTYTISKQRNFLMNMMNMFRAPAKAPAEEDNYDITVEYGTLEVKNRGEDPDDPDGAKYEVEFTAKSDEVTYDGKEHTVEGFTEELTYTNDKGVKYTIEGISASGKGTDAGEYDVETSGTFKVLDPDGNDVTEQFTVTTKDGKLVINPKEVTVTAKDYTKNQGEDDPAFEATVEGLVGDDTVEYTIGREEGEEVGEYALTPEGEEEQGNYTVKFVAGTLTIVDNVPDTGDRTGLDFWYVTMSLSVVCFMAVLLDLKKKRLLA